MNNEPINQSTNNQQTNERTNERTNKQTNKQTISQQTNKQSINQQKAINATGEPTVPRDVSGVSYPSRRRRRCRGVRGGPRPPTASTPPRPPTPRRGHAAPPPHPPPHTPTALVGDTGGDTQDMEVLQIRHTECGHRMMEHSVVVRHTGRGCAVDETHRIWTQDDGRCCG